MREFGRSEGQIPQLKATVFSDRETLRQKLVDAGLYGKDPQVDRFYEKYTELIAEHELVGFGISLSWDIANWYVESIEGDRWDPNHPSFGEVVDVLIDDHDVADQSKAIRIAMFLGGHPQYDNTELERIHAERMEAERVTKEKLTVEEEKIAAERLREAASRLLINNSFKRDSFSLTLDEDGTLNSVWHRAWTISDEDWMEWEQHVRVMPDNKIQVGRKDIVNVFGLVDEPLEIKHFSLNDVNEINELVETMISLYQKHV